MLFTMTQLMNCQFTWRISKHEKTCISFGFFDFGFCITPVATAAPYLTTTVETRTGISQKKLDGYFRTYNGKTKSSLVYLGSVDTGWTDKLTFLMRLWQSL